MSARSDIVASAGQYSSPGPVGRNPHSRAASLGPLFLLGSARKGQAMNCYSEGFSAGRRR